VQSVAGLAHSTGLKPGKALQRLRGPKGPLFHKSRFHATLAAFHKTLFHARTYYFGCFVTRR
jgi:hypothetical protein